MSTQLTDPATAALAVQMDNERAVSVLLSYTPLPHPVVTATPQCVHIVVADIDDLREWWLERGGRVERGAPMSGVRMWMLTTFTDPDRNGVQVEVRVSCAAPMDVNVMDDLLAVSVTR